MSQQLDILAPQSGDFEQLLPEKIRETFLLILFYNDLLGEHSQVDDRLILCVKNLPETIQNLSPEISSMSEVVKSLHIQKEYFEEFFLSLWNQGKFGRPFAANSTAMELLNQMLSDSELAQTGLCMSRFRDGLDIRFEKLREYPLFSAIRILSQDAYVIEEIKKQLRPVASSRKEKLIQLVGPETAEAGNIYAGKIGDIL